jgi:hypothetical protein
MGKDTTKTTKSAKKTHLMCPTGLSQHLHKFAAQDGTVSNNEVRGKSEGFTMNRTTKMKMITSSGITAALALGTLATGIGVASASGNRVGAPTGSFARSLQFSSFGAVSHDRSFGSPEKALTSANCAGGVVTALTATSITVTNRAGTAVTYTITPTTTFTEDRAVATVADLAVGDNVRITLNSTDLVTAVAIDIELAHVGGKVVSVSGDTIVVSNWKGIDATITVASTTTYSMGGAAATLAQVTVGSFVFAEGMMPAGATTLDAVAVGIGQPRSTSSNCHHGGRDQQSGRTGFERGHSFHGGFGGRN